LTRYVVLGRKAALNPRTNREQVERALVGFCDGLVHQQNRNVIAYRICPEAGTALQALAIGFECERLFAGGTNQNIEQILGNHGRILRLQPPRLKPVRISPGATPIRPRSSSRIEGGSGKIGLEIRSKIRRTPAGAGELSVRVDRSVADAPFGRFSLSKRQPGMIVRDVAMPRFDFHRIPRVNFSNVLVPFFHNFLVRASSSLRWGLGSG
jgi:hypothetical protein